ncbi:hypothetical protein [Rhodococcus sp. ABRD24]|uniref:hypothetical protein n=1 Tax=Rhodococcus sp. ABRD24 TaxID=2507582 RepID=UPI0013F165B3|nr:hypothetical protein [Rhodococcus sp. ABRD24]
MGSSITTLPAYFDTLYQVGQAAFAQYPPLEAAAFTVVNAVGLGIFWLLGTTL